MEITQSIAQRTLSYGSEELTVILGMPQPIADGDFLCAYQISFGAETKKGHAIGVDGVQAIQLAMRKIASDLLFIFSAIVCNDFAIELFPNFGLDSCLSRFSN